MCCWSNFMYVFYGVFFVSFFCAQDIVYVYVVACINVYAHFVWFVRMRICVHVCVDMDMDVGVCVCVCVWVWMCV